MQPSQNELFFTNVAVLMEGQEDVVRGSAAEAIGRIGSNKAVDGLRAALKDEGEYGGDKVKDAAFEALEKISRRMGKRIIMEGKREK